MVQELITLPGHLHSPSVCSRVRVARYCFMCNLLQVVAFPFGYCVVRPSSIYSFWLPFGIFILFPTVMPFLWCMASDYLFGIFKPFPTVLSVPWNTASDCHFGSFNILSTVLSVRLRLTGSHYPIGIYKHSINCFVFPTSIYGFWLPLWYIQRFSIALSLPLSFMASDYPFSIFKLLTIDWHEDIWPSA